MYNAINNRYEMGNGGVLNEPTRNNSIARLQEAFDYTSTSGVAFGTTDTLTNNATYKSLFFSEPTADALLLPVLKGTYYKMYLNYYVELETLEEEELSLNIRVDYYDADKVYISSGVPFNITNEDHKIDIQAIGDALDYPANARYVFIGGQNNGDANITVRFRHASVRVSTTKEEEPAEGLLKTSDNKLYVLLGNANGGTPAPIPPTNPTYETVTLNKASNPSIIFNNGSTTMDLTYNSDDELNINGNLLFGGTEVLLNQDDNNKILTLSAKNASTAQFRIGNDPNKQLTYFYETGAIYLSPSCRIFQSDTAFNDDCLTNKKYVDDEIINNCVQLTGNQTVAGDKTLTGNTSLEGSLNLNDNNITSASDIETKVLTLLQNDGNECGTIDPDSGNNIVYYNSVSNAEHHFRCKDGGLNSGILFIGPDTITARRDITMALNSIIKDAADVQTDKLTIKRASDGSTTSGYIIQDDSGIKYYSMSGGTSSKHIFYNNTSGSPSVSMDITNSEIRGYRTLHMLNGNIDMNTNGEIYSVADVQSRKITLLRPDDANNNFIQTNQTNNNIDIVNGSGNNEIHLKCNVNGTITDIFAAKYNKVQSYANLDMTNHSIDNVANATTADEAPNLGQLQAKTANFQSYKIVLNDAFTADTYKTFVMDATIPVSADQTGTYILSANINLTIDGPGQTLADVFGRITVSNAVSGVNTDYGQIFMKEEPTTTDNYGHLTLSKVMTVSSAGNFPSWHVGVRSSQTLNMDVEIIYKMNRISN